MCDCPQDGEEIMKASATSDVSEEACSTGVRVCSWGSDHCMVFADIGRAVGRTELSKLYVSNQLVVPGHQSVPDPGSRPERTRKFIKALLPQQIKCLTLDAEGHLVIPTEMKCHRRAFPSMKSILKLYHNGGWSSIGMRQQLHSQANGHV